MFLVPIILLDPCNNACFEISEATSETMLKKMLVEQLGSMYYTNNRIKILEIRKLFSIKDYFTKKSHVESKNFERINPKSLILEK